MRSVHTNTHTLCMLDSWCSHITRGYERVLKLGWGEGGAALTRPTSPSAHPGGTKGCCSTRDLSLLCPRGSHLPSHRRPNDGAPRPHHCDTSTPTHPPPSPAAPHSSWSPLFYPGVCQRGVCSATGANATSRLPPPHPWPRAQPFILKWRRPGSAPARALGLQPAPLFGLRERLLFQLNLL